MPSGTITKAPKPKAEASSGLKVRKRRRIEISLYIMLVPAVVLTLLFAYGPLFGLAMAFQDFSLAKGIFASDWVGLDNFRDLFKDADFWTALRNTVVISLLKMVFNFLVPISVALLINEVRKERFKRVVQSVIYLPHFISWIVIVGIMQTLFHPENGMVNVVLNTMGIESVDFLNSRTAILPVLIITDVWKNFGYGTIIYMAALTGIDPTLYEAATIDRANRWQRMRYITLPELLPIILLVLTLNMGGLLNGGFDQVFNLQNPLILDSVDILDTFTYRRGFEGLQYDLSTSVSVIKSIVSCVLVSSTYFIAYKKADYRIF